MESQNLSWLVVDRAALQLRLCFFVATKSFFSVFISCSFKCACVDNTCLVYKVKKGENSVHPIQAMVCLICLKSVTSICIKQASKTKSGEILFLY